jgi:hypothetical protein
MGGIVKTLFGSKPKAGKSESGNTAYPWLKDTYSPMATGGTQAYGALNNLLGVGGDADAQQGAYNNYLNNSGFNYIMDNAMQGVTNSAAGKYLLRSGATAKGLQDRASNISKTFFQDYLDRLGQSSQLGLGAGSLISGAGQYSKGTGGTQGSQGLLGSALQAAPFIFSDPALKTDIKPVGTLTVYDYRYKDDPSGTKRRGFMADEVKKVHPDAMGPTVSGFKTIDPLALVGGRR